MGKDRHFLAHMMDRSVIDPELLPGQPIVEIAGERRVLIENHKGVSSYGNDRILVKVPFGTIVICGCGLQMWWKS